MMVSPCTALCSALTALLPWWVLLYTFRSRRSRLTSARGGNGQPIKQLLLVLAGRRRRVQTDQIRRGEGTAVQLSRQTPPEAVWWNLRAMGQQGLALDLAVRSDIECHCRGLRAGATGPLPRPRTPAHVEAGGLERGPQGFPLA